MVDTLPAVRSGLISPGVEPRLLEKASQTAADIIHIELEDGVPPARKAEARQVIVNALRTHDWTNKMTFVRINAVDSGFVEDDIDVVSEGIPTAFLQGKCQGPEDIQYIDGLITKAEEKYGIPNGTIKIASMIERVRALQMIDQIATASPRMIALYIGPSDLGNEVGYRRTYKGQELETLWVRSRVVVAAHAHGLLACDSPCVYFRDPEETHIQARWAYTTGFDAKFCISPRQIDVVNRAFAPSEEELEWAQDVLKGEEEAHDDNRAVWVAQDMMLDAPHVLRAQRIMANARRAGLVAG